MNKKWLLFAAVFLIVGCNPKKEVKVEPTPEPEPVVEQEPVDTMPSLADIESKFQTIHFDFNKYTIRKEDGTILEANSAVLKNYPDINVLIEGHTCDIGTNEYNMALGEKRANAAKDYLVKLGIEEARLSIISYGEEKPLDPAHTEAVRKGNRRAEFKVK